jgi:hypothetical protein
VLDRWSHHHQPQSRNSLLLVVLWSETREECSHICRRRLDGGPFDPRQENGQWLRGNTPWYQVHCLAQWLTENTLYVFNIWSSSQKTQPSTSFTVHIWNSS